MVKNPKRRYLNKKIPYNLGDGAIKGKIILEDRYYFVPDYDKTQKIPISFNGKGKNKVRFKDGVLEKKSEE